MRVRRIFARLFLLFACAASGPSTAAEPREAVDAATVNRILHLNNIAICLDAPALMVTDPARIDRTPASAEKRAGPPLADRQTIDELKNHVQLTEGSYNRINALYQADVPGGEAEKYSTASLRLCVSQARLAWAEGRAAATLSWLEQAVAWSERNVAAVQAAHETNTATLRQMIDALHAELTAKLRARAVRGSIESLRYDLSDVDQQPRLKINDQTELQPHSTAAESPTQLTLSPPTLPPIDAPTLSRILQHLQAAASLEPPSKLTPDVELLLERTISKANSRGPSPADAETIRILESRLRSAKRLYFRVKQLYDLGANGGQSENRALAGLRMCRAEAVLAWAKGDAALAVLWSERAVRWSERWHTEITLGSNGGGYVPPESLFPAYDAMLETTLAANSVRRCCEALGYDLSVKDRSPKMVADEGRNAESDVAKLSGQTTGELPSWQSFLHTTGVTVSLNLPPFTVPVDEQSALTSNPRRPPAADIETIKILTASVKAADSSYKRVYSARFMACEGGPSMYMYAWAAHHQCLCEARLAWAQGEAGMAAAWLNQAVRWTAYGAEAASAEYDTNTIALESFIAAQDAAAESKLLVRSVRQSCEVLGYDLNIADKKPELLGTEPVLNPQPVLWPK